MACKPRPVFALSTMMFAAHAVLLVGLILGAGICLSESNLMGGPS